MSLSRADPTYNVSVVVPMHNEARGVAALVAEITLALADHVPFEIIVVDDASRDRTHDELLSVQANTPNLRIVRHVRNCGQSQATISGVLAAQAPWVVTLDGDGQNNPADISKLFAARDAARAAETTLFIGHRTQRIESAAKMRASRIANGVRAFVLGDATPDSGCGLKLFTRDLFLALPRFDALHRFMPALTIRTGGRVISVPVAHRPRAYGRSHYGILGRGLIGIVDLLGVWWLMRRHTNIRPS